MAIAADRQVYERSWPKSPRALSDRLRRLAPSLRKVGIQVEFEKTAGSNSQRIVTLRRSSSNNEATGAPKM